MRSKHVFVGDTNLFGDAYFISITTVSYKAELRKDTTKCCGLRPCKITTLGGVLFLIILNEFRH